MRGTGFLRVVARLKPGVTLEQVRAALPSLDQAYNVQYPEKIDANMFTTIKTLPEDVTANLRAGFATLFAAVSFVLLIACSNVANLLLVRFSGRRREIALRMALGASRGSVMRLFVFESVLVSAIAGLVGSFVAWQFVPLVPRMAANFLPLEANTATSLSIPVLIFTVALSLLTGLLMGIYPALQSSRADLVDGLKEGGRGSSGSVRQQRFRKILVGAQVALSVTLLAGAALLITSFVRLSQQNTGFNPKNLWVGFITFPEARYPDMAIAHAFRGAVATRVARNAGIRGRVLQQRFSALRWRRCDTLHATGRQRPAGQRTQRRAIARSGAGIFPDLEHSDSGRSRLRSARYRGTSERRFSSARPARKKFSLTRIQSARRCSSRAAACR